VQESAVVTIRLGAEGDPSGLVLGLRSRVLVAGGEAELALLPLAPDRPQAGSQAGSQPGLQIGLGESLAGCRGFTLTLRGGRARFGRSLHLPPGLRGRGLGTYLMAWLVRRAVDLGFGALPVHGLHLIRQQDTPLRNAFYRSMGFELTLYRDGSGWARAPRLDGLRMRHDPAKVREVVMGQSLCQS